MCKRICGTLVPLLNAVAVSQWTRVPCNQTACCDVCRLMQPWGAASSVAGSLSRCSSSSHVTSCHEKFPQRAGAWASAPRAAGSSTPCCNQVPTERVRLSFCILALCSEGSMLNTGALKFATLVHAWRSVQPASHMLPHDTPLLRAKICTKEKNDMPDCTN